MVMRSKSVLQLAVTVLFLSIAALPATPSDAQELPMLMPTADLTSNCAAPCVDGDTSLDGNTAVVPEAAGFASNSSYLYDIVRVFTADASGAWNPQVLLDPDAPPLPTDDSIPVSYYSYFGEHTAVDDKVLLLSSIPHDPNGVTLRYVVHVYRRARGEWSHSQTIVLPQPVNVDSVDITAIALQDDTALVGTTNWSTTAQGTVEHGIVYVYRQGVDHRFHLETDIAPATVENAAFGYPLALQGNTAVIGASGDNDARGAAYVYQRVGHRWAPHQKLVASDGVSGDLFGSAVGLSGHIIAIGAPTTGGYDDAPRGAVYTFNRRGERWRAAQKLVNPPVDFGDGVYISFPFGRTLALAGRRLIVTGELPYDRGYSGIGSYLFERHQGQWSAVAGLAGPLSGASISKSRALLRVESLRFDDYAEVYALPALQPTVASSSKNNDDEESDRDADD